MMTTNRGPPRARSAAATVCGRALSAMLLLSLQAGASSSGSRSPTFTTSRAAPELAFCTPLSPRCFPGRTGASEQAAVRGPVHMALTDNASGASPVITPRKHLGPTAEEIVAARRQDALARKSEVLSSWSLVEGTTNDAIKTYTRPSSPQGSRHLGPTLDEVVSLYRNKPVNSPSTGKFGASPAATTPKTKTIGKVLGASGKFELVDGGPSREQVHALLNLGITQMPATKEEASKLIRERRDTKMGERFGLDALKTEASAPASHVVVERAPAPAPSNARHASPEEHLSMALRGLNMITRR